MKVSLNPYEGSFRPLPPLTNCPNGPAIGVLLAAPCVAAGIAVALVRVATPGVVAPGTEVVQPAGTDNPPNGTALPSPAATPPRPPTLGKAPAAADPAACAAPSTAWTTGARSFASLAMPWKPAVLLPRAFPATTAACTELMYGEMYLLYSR